jgi:hypothetical protein
MRTNKPSNLIYSQQEHYCGLDSNRPNGNISQPCNQIVTVIDNENQQLQTLLQLQRQDPPAPDINVVIGEADNCTANPVAWVSDTSTGSVR